ncbi:MAG TPA: PIN domain-containing protein [Acidimicrobiales bacterium]|nr:PIN domain-containing protein [Acidimicrobiales bacterium]
MSDDRVFVDTSVLVYSYDVDAARKHETARSLLTALWGSRTGAVSLQVLQEFYVTVTRKLPTPLDRRVAREVVGTYRAWPVHRPAVDDVIAASVLEAADQLSFWDALIITSAQRSGAHTLLSEDLQDGRRYGELVVVNPFRPSIPTTELPLPSSSPRTRTSVTGPRIDRPPPVGS